MLACKGLKGLQGVCDGSCWGRTAECELDHHGLVATVCQDLGIAEKLNEALGSADPQWVVSAETLVVAMIHDFQGDYYSH